MFLNQEFTVTVIFEEDDLLILIFLQVRLMGCQDLLEEVPGRSRKDQTVFSSPTDAKSWYKLKPSSSKSYSIKDETSSKFFKGRFLL